MPEEARKRAAEPVARRDLQLLSGDECAAVRESVLAIREHWTRWYPDLPFFTLGAASYRDAASAGLDAYREKSRLLNPILSERFGWLHERLRAALTSEFGREFFYDTSFALPGFHVFEFHDSFACPSASVHVDLQFKDLDWSRWQAVDLEDQISLTLAIRLPAGGGGLRLWPVTYAEIRDMRTAELQRIVAEEPVLHRYREGCLVVHSGYQLHQIAPAPGMRPGDERITLQAHALSVDGGYLLYW
jgi:hypothetical protein